MVQDSFRHQFDASAAQNLGNAVRFAAGRVCNDQVVVARECQALGPAPASGRSPAYELRKAIVTVALEDLQKRGQWLAGEVEEAEKAFAELRRQFVDDYPDGLPALDGASEAVTYATEVVRITASTVRGLAFLSGIDELSRPPLTPERLHR